MASFKEQLDADLLHMLNADEFGDEVVLTPAGGDPVTIHGIFDDEYLSVDAGGEVEIATSSPACSVSLAEIEDASPGWTFSEGDVLEVGDTTYAVVDCRKGVDTVGDGGAVLILQEA